jgi:hypothetical protein
MGVEPNIRVLLIRGHAGVNYTRELTWIGIARMVRQADGVAAEYPSMDFMYRDYPGNPATLYGNGFTYSRTLDPVSSVQDIIPKILERYWDIIIYGKVGPDELREGSLPNLPLWEHVFACYGKCKIAFFYGGDECNDLTCENRYRQHLAHHAQYAMCFVRECKGLAVI